MTIVLHAQAAPSAEPLNAAPFLLDLAGLESEALTAAVPPADLSGLRARTTRIFQIGFNKCGTRSLYRFLQRSGIHAAHFNRGLLAFGLRENIAAGRQPLAGKIGRYAAFTDMQQVTRDFAIEGIHYFRELHAYYPNSYFILNTRDKDGWIRSRLRHGAGAYARRYGRALKLSEETDVVRAWSEDWDRHHAAVIDHFAEKPGRLLVYDIKHDDPQKMVEFLAPDFLTRVEDFRHEGDTATVDADSYKANTPIFRGADAQAESGRKRRRKRKENGT
jgi:hypothetical protein